MEAYTESGGSKLETETDLVSCSCTTSSVVINATAACVKYEDESCFNVGIACGYSHFPCSYAARSFEFCDFDGVALPCMWGSNHHFELTFLVLSF